MKTEVDFRLQELSYKDMTIKCACGNQIEGVTMIWGDEIIECEKCGKKYSLVEKLDVYAKEVKAK